jgi:hypothetical protein
VGEGYEQVKNKANGHDQANEVLNADHQVLRQARTDTTCPWADAAVYAPESQSRRAWSRVSSRWRSARRAGRRPISLALAGGTASTGPGTVRAGGRCR